MSKRITERRRPGPPSRVRREEVVNDVRYFRYPDAKQRAHRVYFVPQRHAQATLGVESLHREIWKAAHRSIPPGHIIHHIDGNPLNNSVENLECMQRSEHFRHHPEARCWSHEHMDRIRPKNTLWQCTPEGRAFLRENGRRIAAMRPVRSLTCSHCGVQFSTLFQGPMRFCSKRCAAKSRQERQPQKACRYCGRGFRPERDRQQCCSRSCRSRAIIQARLAAGQHVGRRPKKSLSDKKPAHSNLLATAEVEP